MAERESPECNAMAQNAKVFKNDKKLTKTSKESIKDTIKVMDNYIEDNSETVKIKGANLKVNCKTDINVKSNYVIADKVRAPNSPLLRERMIVSKSNSAKTLTKYSNESIKDTIKVKDNDMDENLENVIKEKGKNLKVKAKTNASMDNGVSVIANKPQINEGKHKGKSVVPKKQKLVLGFKNKIKEKILPVMVTRRRTKIGVKTQGTVAVKQLVIENKDNQKLDSNNSSSSREGIVYCSDIELTSEDSTVDSMTEVSRVKLECLASPPSDLLMDSLGLESINTDCLSLSEALEFTPGRLVSNAFSSKVSRSLKTNDYDTNTAESLGFASNDVRVRLDLLANSDKVYPEWKEHNGNSSEESAKESAASNSIKKKRKKIKIKNTTNTLEDAQVIIKNKIKDNGTIQEEKDGKEMERDNQNQRDLVFPKLVSSSNNINSQKQEKYMNNNVTNQMVSYADKVVNGPNKGNETQRITLNREDLPKTTNKVTYKIEDIEKEFNRTIPNYLRTAFKPYARDNVLILAVTDPELNFFKFPIMALNILLQDIDLLGEVVRTFPLPNDRYIAIELKNEQGVVAFLEQKLMLEGLHIVNIDLKRPRILMGLIKNCGIDFNGDTLQEILQCFGVVEEFRFLPTWRDFPHILSNTATFRLKLNNGINPLEIKTSINFQNMPLILNFRGIPPQCFSCSSRAHPTRECPAKKCTKCGFNNTITHRCNRETSQLTANTQTKTNINNLSQQKPDGINKEKQQSPDIVINNQEAKEVPSRGEEWTLVQARKISKDKDEGKSRLPSSIKDQMIIRNSKTEDLQSRTTTKRKHNVSSVEDESANEASTMERSEADLSSSDQQSSPEYKMRSQNKCRRKTISKHRETDNSDSMVLQGKDGKLDINSDAPENSEH